MKKDLLKMEDLSKEEILEILNLGDQLKYENKHNIKHQILEGKTLGMIFQKASTRTRFSFEVGMYQLGGYPLYANANDMQIGRGEPIQDTARVLSRYLDGIMIRTYSQEEVEKLAQFSSIPIINGLTDDEHPCQILADLMTIREKKFSFEGLKICYIGDGNNMAHSLIVGALSVGMNISLAIPKDYMVKEHYIQKGLELSQKENVNFEIVQCPKKAIKDADVVITDVWASMGQEEEANERKIAFDGYVVNDELMSLAKEDAIVLHCLPAHREEEISTSVFEKHADTIFEEAENRLHVQKAILVKCMNQD